MMQEGLKALEDNRMFEALADILDEHGVQVVETNCDGNIVIDKEDGWGVWGEVTDDIREAGYKITAAMADDEGNLQLHIDYTKQHPKYRRW